MQALIFGKFSEFFHSTNHSRSGKRVGPDGYGPDDAARSITEEVGCWSGIGSPGVFEDETETGLELVC